MAEATRHVSVSLKNNGVASGAPSTPEQLPPRLSMAAGTLGGFGEYVDIKLHLSHRGLEHRPSQRFREPLPNQNDYLRRTGNEFARLPGGNRYAPYLCNSFVNERV